MNVENIQDIIETMLMDGKRKDVARAFVRYRYKRELVREAKTNLDNENFWIKRWYE